MRTFTGYVVFFAALGMMCGLAGNEITKLQSWNAIYTPEFVGKILLEISTVIATFLGGKLIPTQSDRREVWSEEERKRRLKYRHQGG